MRYVTLVSIIIFAIILNPTTKISEAPTVLEPVEAIEVVEGKKYKAAREKGLETVKSQPKPQVMTGCESFRAVTAKYFPASQVNNALFVFSKESGCRHPTSVNATGDSGLCQLHNEYIADLDRHVKRCSDKYYNARIGSNNWSAWYAVCAPNPAGIMLTPVQLYANVHCS